MKSQRIDNLIKSSMCSDFTSEDWLDLAAKCLDLGGVSEARQVTIETLIKSDMGCDNMQAITPTEAQELREYIDNND